MNDLEFHVIPSPFIAGCQAVIADEKLSFHSVYRVVYKYFRRILSRALTLIARKLALYSNRRRASNSVYNDFNRSG